MIFMIALILIMVINGELSLAQIHTKEISQKDKVSISQKNRLEGSQARDPFSLPSGVHLLSKDKADSVAKEMESGRGASSQGLLPGQRVKAILISKHVRLALIDRHIVIEGDTINGEKVVEIRPDKVILGKGGKKRSLLLYQSAIPLRIEEN